MPDILGQAIAEYYLGNQPGKLWIHNTYGRKENMPVKIYFRAGKQLPQLELMALAQCRGSVLDIGAGAGSHASVLQDQNIAVTALDISKRACAIMRNRGVEEVVAADIWKYSERRFDTLLLLMNGVGLTATLTGFAEFLERAKMLLNPGGQILFDSSDVAYLHNEQFAKPDHYYGEIDYRYEYKGRFTRWFKWLYIDKGTMRKIAGLKGYKTRILYEDENGQYLARLKPGSTAHEI